jgi:hypothetical protein
MPGLLRPSVLPLALEKTVNEGQEKTNKMQLI